MEKHEYQSEFARRYVQQGIQRAVLTLAQAKVGSLSLDDEARIRDLADAAALERLLLELGGAVDEDAARAVLARLRRR